MNGYPITSILSIRIAFVFEHSYNYYVLDIVFKPTLKTMEMSFRKGILVTIQWQNY